MKNVLIGNPLELLEEYFNREVCRGISTMTKDECIVILDLATDNGDFKGIAVNHLKITSSADNFVEGEVSFGNKLNCYFAIRYDATVEIHKMKFDEKKTKFVHTKERLRMYRFADITFYMMKRGFNLHKHLI